MSHLLNDATPPTTAEEFMQRYTQLQQFAQQLTEQLQLAQTATPTVTTSFGKAKPKEPDTFHGLGKI